MKILNGFLSIFDLTVNIISNTLDFENSLPGRNIDEILNNPDDKLKIEEAIEELKNNKQKEYKDVPLSNNEVLTISLS